jgi:hypothetical protein
MWLVTPFAYFNVVTATVIEVQITGAGKLKRDWRENEFSDFVCCCNITTIENYCSMTSQWSFLKLAQYLQKVQIHFFLLLSKLNKKCTDFCHL